MKKFLSMVLALALSASLFTVGASAKDFTDDSKITYNEAVDVISEIGVVDGYTDGSFGPTTELTRGAAAKIICNLLLGPTTASALGADTAPYKDVPTSNVFSGYIAYCKQQNIISGYADGSFRPAAPLTGYAFMKMLLGALGYDSAIEGYTGANWSVAVAKQALNIGLDDGNDNFVGTKAVTREEACLYAFNMLQADMVEYGSKTTVNVNGAVVTVGENKAQSRKWTSSATADGNIDGKGGDGIVQFAEEYFNKLVKDTNTDADDFGRPATKWVNKGVKIGTYAEKADKVYVGSVKVNDIYNDLGMSSEDKTAQVFMNGVEVTPSGFSVKKANGDKLKELSFVAVADAGSVKKGATVANRIGDGTIVEVYRDDDDNHVDIVAISVYGGKISAVKDATSKKDAYVVVEAGDKTEALPATFSTSDHDEFETTGFEEDDIVAFTYSDSAEEIKSMYKLESVDGELTKRVVGKSVTLGDTTYKFAKEYNFESGLAEGDLSNKSDYTVYTDANGYALWIEETDANVSAYAYVENITGESDGNVTNSWIDGNRAKLVFSDGSEKTVTLNKDYYANGSYGFAAAGNIVRYKVESDGDYKLMEVKTQVAATNNFAISNKALKNVTVNGNTIYGDSKTLFVVKEGDDFKTYTGVKNVPDVSGTSTAAVYYKDTTAKVVFVLSGNVVNSSKDVTFIAADSATKLVTANDTEDYYQYNAVVKGQITTVMVAYSHTDNGTTTRVILNGATYNLTSGTDGKNHNIILNSTSSDSDDIMYAGSFVNRNGVTAVENVLGVKKVSSDEVKLAGHTYNVASDVKVYIINKDGDIEAATMSDVKTNSDNYASYTMEDGEITNLFIQEVDD